MIIEHNDSARKLPRRVGKKAPEIDVVKLTKLVRLLSTDQDGELLATVAAINRILTVAGLDFGDLADAVESGLMPRRTKAVAKRSPPEPDLDYWESMAWWCHYQRHHLLSENDRGYLQEVLLGDPRHFDCGRVPRDMMDRLRGIVAKIRDARSSAEDWS